MSIQYPNNRNEVVDRIKTDIQNELPETQPFLRNSTLSADATGYGGACYDLYQTIRQLQTQLMPDTAEGEFALRWGGLKNIIPYSATQSSGYITATGQAGVGFIPAGTTLQSDSGLTYTVLNDSSIVAYSISISILTRDGSTAHATSSVPHHLASGNVVTISGAGQPEYNGAHLIYVTGDSTFDFEVTGSPAIPATGAILASLSSASVQVQSVNFGANTNLGGGDDLTFTSTIPGVDYKAIIQYDGLTGGSDAESDAAYRDRYLTEYRFPSSSFNENQIIAKAKSVSGVTRVWVEGLMPAVGQITVYFVMDNSPNIIPTPQNISDVKDALLTIKTAATDPDDVIVLAPIPVTVNFTFTVIDPDTDSMLTAVTENLKQFFYDYPQVGEAIPQVAYESTIWQTIDPTTGKFIKNFTLSSPIGDITVAAGELAILGNVT